MVWKIDSSHTSVEFSVRHMMMAKVKGGFTSVKGTVELDEVDPSKSFLEVEIGTASIDTREPKRDAHLRSSDFFDVERFPVMRYESRRIERNGERYKVIGDLTIRGITKEVVLNVDFAGIANDPFGFRRAGFSAEAAINRRDFDLNWNATLETGGVLVGEKVNISVEAEVVSERPAAKAA